MIDSRDVIIMDLNLDIRVYITQRARCRFHFTLPRLMWLEEQPVHIRQLHGVVIEQYQLKQESSIDASSIDIPNT